MVVRKVIEIDEDLCTGCGKCVTACAEGALEIVNGKAKVVSDKFCDGLGACIGDCPEGALKIVERDVEKFDERAVKEHLNETDRRTELRPRGATACPSSRVRILDTEPRSTHEESRGSRLGHWPIKLMLVPETAPFLRDRELVVLADCAAVAYAGLHEELLDGKAIVIGCPKFADARTYIEKLARIVKNGGVRELTIVHMEVPCCFGLKKISEEAVGLSGRKIPVREVVITTKGDAIQPRE
ncbi:MAG: 4Fe-4S binding protein [Methanomassiliicoccales archaeon]|nr:4Fe-4S binding protein [Methanomassiliicoccales archaeon]